MENIMFAVVNIGTVVVALAAFVAGAVFSYLFLRANPNKKSVLDKEVDKLKRENDL